MAGDKFPGVGIKIQRCINSYRRAWLFITIGMTLCVAVLWIVSLLRDEVHVSDRWRHHSSFNRDNEVIFQIDIEKIPRSNPDYYDDDNSKVLYLDYNATYQADIDEGLKSVLKPGEMGEAPIIKDYSIELSKTNIFKNPPQEKLEVLLDYKNPCWAEMIPKQPYKNNSYLNLDKHSEALNKDFQDMRRTFAKRQHMTNKWRTRCMPGFYIMEVPPTNFIKLHTILGFHPFVKNPEIEEPEFWNERGPALKASFKDYVDLFDSSSEKIRVNATVFKDKATGDVTKFRTILTGDGTSSYLWNFENWNVIPENKGREEPQLTVPDLIKRLTPEVRIVIVLRNPTQRLYQGYLANSNNTSPEEFHTAVSKAITSMTDCFNRKSWRACAYDSNFNKMIVAKLRIGMYYPFVSDWKRAFASQVLILRHEDFVYYPSKTINEVCNHLGLAQFPVKHLTELEKRILDERSKNSRNRMLTSTEAMLNAFYEGFNNKLVELLHDEKFHWKDEPELARFDDFNGANSYREQLHLQEMLYQQQQKQQAQESQQKEQLERQQKEQQERERQQKEQQERQQKEQQERDRQQQERDRQQKEQQERDRQQKEQQERERQVKEQQERERLQKEQQKEEERNLKSPHLCMNASHPHRNPGCRHKRRLRIFSRIWHSRDRFSGLDRNLNKFLKLND